MRRDDEVDPRVTRTRQLVLSGVLQELADVGHSRFTVESVAARCGVSKSTIYRHWDGKTHLVLDAMRTLNTQPSPDVRGSARQRVRQLLDHLREALTDDRMGPATAALIEAAERHAEVRESFHAYAASRREALVAAIASGVDDGEFDGSIDPELAAQALAGAVFYARLMTPEVPSGTTLDRLITTVLGPPPD